ncbi:enterochelin esterase-like enzyme [Acidovorax sp. CF316]|uniref:alpha/beta hydrolase n=1 Tax=Acidovorax sp. CF316 TaxID=1144317 RepID=UPI00026BD392|nr:alpha/beta hydrolase-fold protein [Acidovorax sp. CF316]EJE52618.1 enterochelin esterase-like enzyme [Acidovorax sp. CF316]
MAQAPRGTLEHLRLASTRLANERDVSLYLPAPPPATGQPLPLLVLFDRDAYLDRADVPALLDALIAQRRIPPLAAVFVGHPAPALRGTELPANPGFADFLAHELMPWLRARQPGISHGARDVVVAGSSYGGLAAAFAGYRHPGVFGNVLALSGSFWWGPRNVPRAPDFERFGEGEWLTREFAASARLPLRFFITAGLMEITLTGDGGGILDTSRHLRTVLQAKGYPVHYQEFAGGHDYYAWRGELAQGLVHLLGERMAAP